MRVFQFLSSLEPSAVGSHAVALEAAMRSWGVETQMFSPIVAEAWRDRARPHTDYGRSFRAHRDDVLLYHLAIGSEVADHVLTRPERLVVDYHNFTPAEYFDRWAPQVVPGIRWGIAQRKALGARAVLGLADSAFNELDLRQDGYRATDVLPILLDPADFDRPVDEDCAVRLAHDKARGGIDLLFVGRIAPNKAQHDLVKVLYAYRKAFDPNARLRLVGGSSSDRYLDAVRTFAAELGLADAVEFTGPVSGGQLAAHFRNADVFVSVSEHEGFCVPLLESMAAGVPIVAYGSTAIPGTLEGAGIVLDQKSPELVAAAIDRVAHDRDLRDALVRAGTERLDAFAPERTIATFRRQLEMLG